jgi:hypothetical protein
LNLSGPKVDAAHALVEHSEGEIMQHAAAPQPVEAVATRGAATGSAGKTKKGKRRSMIFFQVAAGHQRKTHHTA